MRARVIRRSAYSIHTTPYLIHSGMMVIRFTGRWGCVIKLDESQESSGPDKSNIPINY